MREIKFRGKYLFPDVYHGVNWLYGGYAEIDGDGFIFPEGNFHYGHGDYWANDDFPDIPVVDKNTVGQYTGLKDKNGKEIYEGDIMQSESRGFLYVIKYHKTSFLACQIGIEHYSLSFFGEDIEVIGNIHDNPELLERLYGVKPKEEYPVGLGDITIMMAEPRTEEEEAEYLRRIEIVYPDDDTSDGEKGDLRFIVLGHARRIIEDTSVEQTELQEKSLRRAWMKLYGTGYRDRRNNVVIDRSGDKVKVIFNSDFIY